MYKAKQHTISGKRVRLLSGWERAISEAHKKIAKLQNSILIFEEMRDKGEPFPGDTFESTSKVLGQKGDSGQSRHRGYFITTVYFITTLANLRISP